MEINRVTTANAAFCKFLLSVQVVQDQQSQAACGFQAKPVCGSRNGDA
jgi:hypothetical protein